MPTTPPKPAPKPAGRPPVGRTVNVRLPDDLLAWLDVQARRQGVTRAAFVRNALNAARAQS